MFTWQRMVKPLMWAAVMVMLLAFKGRLPAQEKNWIGETVLHTRPINEIKFVAQVGGQEYPFTGSWPFQVRDEKDGRLRIHDRGNEGWVNKADFVLLRDAVAYFSRRVEANPRDTFVLGMRGAAYLQQKELDNAISDYDACIKLNATNTHLYNNRGLALSYKKEYDKAIDDFSQAIKLNSSNVVAYVNRGVACYHKKEYDNAIKDYDEAIRREPNYAWAFYERGLAWRGKKEIEKAIKDFDDAIRFNPTYSKALHERGLAHGGTRNYAKALADYEAAVRSDPKYTAAWADQAWLLATCPDARYRDGKKAVTAARKACELSDYKTPAHLSTLAAALAETGDFKEAIRWQKTALLEFPDYAKTEGENARQRLMCYEWETPFHEAPLESRGKSPKKRVPRDTQSIDAAGVLINQLGRHIQP